MNKQERIEIEYAMCVRYLEGLIFGNPENNPAARACCSNAIKEMQNAINNIREEPTMEADHE